MTQRMKKIEVVLGKWKLSGLQFSIPEVLNHVSLSISGVDSKEPPDVREIVREKYPLGDMRPIFDRRMEEILSELTRKRGG